MILTAISVAVNLLLLGALAYRVRGKSAKQETPPDVVMYASDVVELSDKLSLVKSEDEEITEWMPRLDIDLRDHTVIETIECGDCGNKDSFVMTMADELISTCPKCKSRAVFIRSDHADTKKEIPPFQTVMACDPPEDWSPENDNDDTEPLFG